MSPADFNELKRLVHYDALVRRKRDTECSGKQVFATHEDASAVAERRGRQGHVGRKPYRCRWCQKFHIGRISITPAYRQNLNARRGME